MRYLDLAMQSNQESVFPIPESIFERIVLLLIASMFGTLGLWIGWIAHKFQDNRTWGDWLVQFLLHDLVAAIVMFAIAIILFAVSPSPTSGLLGKILLKLVMIVFLIVGLAILTPIVLLIWGGILYLLGELH